ncbi:hypothetical protein K470DRAFT_19992 [Piedraia hortae CBS 480.64]|uniref:Uncharacterized protein n=1 Tax=Piedraia hortae CBS 480.64 TaxID=1314780 RepID=A0A6A7BNV5_9PEZI|nr:hypothetical protein K470DRAFT_19992 [Piedraia hortae CBS 480.64]
MLHLHTLALDGSHLSMRFTLTGSGNVWSGEVTSCPQGHLLYQHRTKIETSEDKDLVERISQVCSPYMRQGKANAHVAHLALPSLPLGRRQRRCRWPRGDGRFGAVANILRRYRAAFSRQRQAGVVGDARGARPVGVVKALFVQQVRNDFDIDDKAHEEEPNEEVMDANRQRNHGDVTANRYHSNAAGASFANTFDAIYRRGREASRLFRSYLRLGQALV